METLLSLAKGLHQILDYHRTTSSLHIARIFHDVGHCSEEGSYSAKTRVIHCEGSAASTLIKQMAFVIDRDAIYDHDLAFRPDKPDFLRISKAFDKAWRNEADDTGVLQGGVLHELGVSQAICRYRSIGKNSCDLMLE